jgi:hypothetical protein
MSDAKNDPVARNVLARQGVQGVVFLAGGIIVMIAARGGAFGIVAGALAAIVGIALMGSRPDRFAGIVALAAGLVTLLAGIFSRPLGWLLWLMRTGGLALAAVGGYWIVKFVLNLRKRM